eukprot:4880019-Pyramimonas_sp.AAC.1
MQSRRIRAIGMSLVRLSKRIFASGTLPCIGRGSSARGVSDTEVHVIGQQSASKILRPQAAGRSPTSLMILGGTPSRRCEVAPILWHPKEVQAAHAHSYLRGPSFQEPRVAGEAGCRGGEVKGWNK